MDETARRAIVPATTIDLPNQIQEPGRYLSSFFDLIFSAPRCLHPRTTMRIVAASSLRTSWRACHRTFSTKRTAVVVGATSGIGEACAHRLAEEGFLVVAVGRGGRPGRAEAVVETLTAKSAAAKSADVPSHEFVACDAFSLSNIRETAEAIQAKHPIVDALVMTQGMATTQGFTPTVDGNDQKMTLHYYSRMGMIQSLLPALKQSSMPAVVLSILSGGVHSPYPHLDTDPSLEKNYSIKNAADAAGFYNDLCLDQFAVDHPEIRFVHACPGFVNTNWGSEFHPILRSLVRLIQPFGKSASECAELLLGATVLADSLPAPPVRPDGSTSGVFIVGEKGDTQSLTKAHSVSARDVLWKHTQDVLGKAGIR